MRHCIRCDEWKDESEFNIRNEERGLLQSVCKDCQKQNGRDRYASSKANVLEINRQSMQRSKIRASLFIQEYLSDKSCVDCGEDDISVLTFDHVRGEKKYNISDIVTRGYNIESIKTELQKTEIVCFNCHMRREQKRRGYGRFERFGR